MAPASPYGVHICNSATYRPLFLPLNPSLFVIPAEAGIQHRRREPWIPASAGMTKKGVETSSQRPFAYAGTTRRGWEA